MSTPPRTRQVCTRCWHSGATTAHTSGSVGIEVILWLCAIVPGLLYTLWRLSTRRPACPLCGSAEVIPAGSHRARAILADAPAAQVRQDPAVFQQRRPA